ncbi:hypothetical protein [Streptomyces fumanus]|uniref:Uncharacterized protein n=1 Tax=Streptomyces fumanus TaxID=67302 RepID=A0A919A8H2_9ACTN|nr:hypothetical protein [Streptomyces fumanus]GHE93130.1 hypothetical protein GCM10018772_16120 [Streptomyces fumanus]
MSTPHGDEELSHPLEQVTGEKDVPPEEEASGGDEGAAGREGQAGQDTDEAHPEQDAT